MRHLLSIIRPTFTVGFLLLIRIMQSNAQQLDPQAYVQPLREVAGYFSANFGEMRSNHFHSGVDFKTDGQEGKPVVAVADGYVSRILCSHAGYGRALYIVHPNGTTSVYGHLQRFAPKLEAFLKQERHRQQSNRIDMVCDPALFPVRQGEEIGRSGNSGTSYGPHLHFEIRDNRTGRTLNTIAQGVITPKDQIPPYLFRLHYVEVDTLRGVPFHSKLATYEVEKRDKAHYRLRQTEAVEVGHNGYFIIEASDRKDKVSNTFGIYRLQAFLNDTCYFEYRMDGFSFEHSRYCNAVSYFPLQTTSRNEVLRLAKIDGNLEEFYPTLKNRGVVSLDEGEKATLKLLAEDDCGNCSQLTVPLVGKAADKCFRAPIDTLAQVVNRQRTFSHSFDGVEVTIPAGSLYESTFYKQSRTPIRNENDSTILILSPCYKILDRSIPLHKSIRIAIECFVPRELRGKACLASRNREGTLYRVGGKWEGDAVHGTVGTLGEFFVAADITAPQIIPLFDKNQKITSDCKLRFRVKEEFSGIGQITALLDGRWIPADYHAIRGIVTLAIQEQIAPAECHSITLRISDGCGNTTTWQGSF